MSSRSEQIVTVAAIAVLVFGATVTWQVGDVRADQAQAARADDMVREHVQSRQAPADYDGDGVRDGSDVCPTRPETKNGFQDGDGCPDVVATTGAS